MTDLSFLPRNITNRIELLRNDSVRIGAEDEYELPGVRIFATKVDTILQNGPQCGLVALEMAATTLGQGQVTLDEIFTTAKEMKMTRNGEMYSSDWMTKLGQAMYPELSVLKREFPSVGELSNELLKGNLWLVPYDCDKNHEPTLHNGHKAHWAIVVGFVFTSFDAEEIDPVSEPLSEKELNRPLHVLAQHGKSRFLALWSYDQFKKSNAQLHSAGPERPEDEFTLPETGIDLSNGCVLVARK